MRPKNLVKFLISEFPELVRSFRPEYFGPTCREDEEHPSTMLILCDRGGYVRGECRDVANFIGIVQITWAAATCALLGHDWTDEGWASPDSGCISMCCRRCGRGEPTVWLY
jgi:hypothetical protein